MAPPLRAIVACLDAGRLKRFLAHHTAFFETNCLVLGNDTPAWRAWLAGVLNGDNPALPAALQFALSAVGDLATAEGEGRLRALAAELGVTVPVSPGRAADVAVWAYLDERAPPSARHTPAFARPAGALLGCYEARGARVSPRRRVRGTASPRRRRPG